MSNPQSAIHAQSLKDREAFWSAASRQIHWHKPPTVAFGKTDRVQKDYVENGAWFPNAEREWMSVKGRLNEMKFERVGSKS